MDIVEFKNDDVCALSVSPPLLSLLSSFFVCLFFDGQEKAVTEMKINA